MLTGIRSGRSVQRRRGKNRDRATRGEGAPCGRRVPVTAEVARARMRRLGRAKRRFDHWREKRRAARIANEGSLALAPYRPRARRADMDGKAERNHAGGISLARTDEASSYR